MEKKKIIDKRRGFTLIEIMVVVVIIGLLSALVGPRLIGQSEEAKIKTTRTQIAQLEQVLGLFHLDNGSTRQQSRTRRARPQAGASL